VAQTTSDPQEGAFLAVQRGARLAQSGATAALGHLNPLGAAHSAAPQHEMHFIHRAPAQTHVRQSAPHQDLLIGAFRNKHLLDRPHAYQRAECGETQMFHKGPWPGSGDYRFQAASECTQGVSLRLPGKAELSVHSVGAGNPCGHTYAELPRLPEPIHESPHTLPVHPQATLLCKYLDSPVGGSWAMAQSRPNHRGRVAARQWLPLVTTTVRPHPEDRRLRFEGSSEVASQ
jgi:hypothetical protein